MPIALPPLFDGHIGAETIFLAGLFAVAGLILFTAATIELWADAKARAYARKKLPQPVKNANCADCGFKAIPGHTQCSVHFSKPDIKMQSVEKKTAKATPAVNKPAIWAIPCTALSPDSRLRCDLEAGHLSWHSCDGSKWYGDNWNVDEFADTQQRPATQDDTMCAADWAASNPKKIIGPEPLEFDIGLFGTRRPRKKTRSPQSDELFFA